MSWLDWPELSLVVTPTTLPSVATAGSRPFFCDDDYHNYKSLLTAACAKKGVAIWAYCLMPNHVHLIAAPETEKALATAIGEAHEQYTRQINFGRGWRGHLWQGRFASVVLDGSHLLAAVRYVERNPVRARMCATPWAYPWSSAAAHVTGKDDGLVTIKPLLGVVPDWRAYVSEESGEAELKARRKHERTGRPLGSEGFVRTLERLLSRPLFRQKPGPKPKRQEEECAPNLLDN